MLERKNSEKRFLRTTLRVAAMTKTMKMMKKTKITRTAVVTAAIIVKMELKKKMKTKILMM